MKLYASTMNPADLLPVLSTTLKLLRRSLPDRDHNDWKFLFSANPLNHMLI